MTAKKKPPKKSAVWVDFSQKKVKARLVKDGAKMSLVEYLEDIDMPTYTAKKGEERRVSNMFITPRR